MTMLWNTDTIRAGLHEIGRLSEILRARKAVTFSDLLAYAARSAMMKEQGLRRGEELAPGDIRDQVIAHLAALEQLLMEQLKALEADRCQGNCRI